MKMRLALALASIAAAPVCGAADVRVLFTGAVTSLAPAPASGPLAAAQVGDAVRVALDVEYPATAGIPGLTAGYVLDPAAASWSIGAQSGAFVQGGVILFDGFIAGQDWVRALSNQIAPSERLDISLDDPTGTVFGSPDLLAEAGVYPAARFVTNTFAFSAGDGGVVRVALGELRIEPLEVGSSYCAPAVPNSTGVPAVAAALGSPVVAENDLLLAAFELPQQSFGYFLASRTQGLVVQPGGSQGTLCLGGSIGRFNALVMSSGSLGVIHAQVDLTAFPQPSGAVAVQPGESWSFQAWYRDANPTSTSNFTDGVTVSFL